MFTLLLLMESREDGGLPLGFAKWLWIVLVIIVFILIGEAIYLFYLQGGNELNFLLKDQGVSLPEKKTSISDKDGYKNLSWYMKNYVWEDLVQYYNNLFSKVSEDSHFVRLMPEEKCGTDTKNMKLAGVDLIGKLQNIDRREQLITISVDDEEFIFDASNIDKVFILDVECDDFYTLCREKEDVGFEEISQEEFFGLSIEKGTQVRLFFNEFIEQTEFAQVKQIILQKQ